MVLATGSSLLTFSSIHRLLRPRNFFTQNPCLDVPPSYSSAPSQVAAGKTGIRGVVDSLSRLAFGGNEKGGSNDCGCK
jgi:primary-amine oxidase